MKIKRIGPLFGLLALVMFAAAGVLFWPNITPTLPGKAPEVSTDTPRKRGSSPQTVTVAPTPGRAEAMVVQAGNQPATRAALSPAAPNQRPQTITEGDVTYPVRPYRTLAVPNDPSGNQWWVSQTNMDDSWDIPAGSEQTVLAIIDTGFALNHEEFTNRWYTNSGESGATVTEAASALNCTDRSLALAASCNLIDDDGDGLIDEETGLATYQNPSRLNCTAQGRAVDKSCNRTDDDGNGYIDDTSGWDFVNGDNSTQAGELNPSGTGTTHGSRVAGIAAATGNNNKGIAGVDWNTRILPIQAIDDDDYGDSIGVANSIDYAVAMGVDVISISLGSDGSDPFVRIAVQEALAAGIPVVAAAGNDPCDCMVYPAAYPEAFAVAALNTSNQSASFNSYGANLDILAPGVNLTSTNWLSSNQTAAYVSGISGTSYSTPMVAAMMTRFKSWQPNATPAQMLAAVTESVNRLSLADSTITDTQHGFGTLDAGKAATRMTTPKNGQINYGFTPISRGGAFQPSTPAEPAGNTFAYSCETGAWPGTQVYELSKNSTHFFTISKSERQKAIQAGYADSLLTYACLRQPHDTVSVMRSLNIFKEFRNLDYKGVIGL